MARAGSHLPLAQEIRVRLPFIAAFLCMCTGIYIFIGRRYPAGYALAGLLFALTLPSLFFYMTEARAYAMMLGGVSLGMVFWQSAAEQPDKQAKRMMIAMRHLPELLRKVAAWEKKLGGE